MQELMVPRRDGAHATGIRFIDVTVSYRRTVAVDRLSLDVTPGEIMAIIGPSGSGKTSALRAVAGFVRPSAGRIHIGDRDVTDLPPHARDTGMVVQSYALFPHMRVAENVAFGLRARRAPRAMVRARVAQCLQMVGMEEYASRLPRQLSGGQQQRVAIARALAIQPSVLLLDEPLSALDAQIRRTMLDELARLHRELPDVTVLYVTHDQMEALTLADRIAIMREGRLVAHGPSQRLYREPPTRFAAQFLGHANLLPVRFEAEKDGHAQVRFGDTPLRARMPHGRPNGHGTWLCVRPRAVSLSDGGENVLHGTVRGVLWQGDQHSITLDVQGHEVRVVSAHLDDEPGVGDVVAARFAARDATLVSDAE
jgi:2-aminoethylphosphonate transport system ATP-binding protein